MTSKVMKYNCECCGYATQNKSNFQRHTKTKKHQRNIGLCVENLHEHYSTSDDCQDAEYYEPEEIARMVFVSWDGDNDRLQEMMDSEEHPVNDDVKRNCMWVEKLKEKAKNRTKRFWVNDGIKENLINIDESIPIGYNKGRVRT